MSQSLTSRRRRMKENGKFVCGHDITPENSKRSGTSHKCRQCADAALELKRQLREDRDDQIRAYVLKGHTVQDAARHFGLGYQICRQAVGGDDFGRRAKLMRDPLYAQRALKAAAEAAGARVDQLKLRWQQRPLVYARWAFMAAMYRRGASYERIGRLINRDHSTVIYGVRKAEKLMSRPDFADLVAKVEAA